jgi:hypothetical protein
MSGAGGLVPGRLWSLWDMLSFFARPFVILGEQLHEIDAIVIFKDENKPYRDNDWRHYRDISEIF